MLTQGHANFLLSFHFVGFKKLRKAPRHPVMQSRKRGGGMATSALFYLYDGPGHVQLNLLTDFFLNDIKTLCTVRFCCCFNVSKNKIDYNLLSFFFRKSPCTLNDDLHRKSKFTFMCAAPLLTKNSFLHHKIIKTPIRLLSKQKSSTVDNESEFKPLQYFECTHF